MIAFFQEEGIQESCSISLRSYLPPSACHNFQGKKVQQSQVDLEVKLALILPYCSEQDGVGLLLLVAD